MFVSDKLNRSTPEEAPKQVQEHQLGQLKIFLGYAPGVGKTYSMLNEANRRFQRGQDVVIGYLETHKREDTIKQIGSLEVLPLKKVEYNGISIEEMDTDAIIARKPEFVLIDELAHTNVPASKHIKRYEDVEDILNAGINVISTLNIQHLESLNNVIRQITGVKVSETIPDKIVNNAYEVVVIDITPDALQNRLKRGNVYKSDIVDKSLKNFFRKGNLNALREITLRQTAEGVDEDLNEYMKQHGINDNWYIVERVMVCISTSTSAKKLIRRGARIAKRYKCEWLVVNVDCANIFASKMTQKDHETLEGHQKLARQLGAEVVTLTGKSISGALATFATERHITQLIIGHSKLTKWQTFLRGSTVTKLLNKTKDIEVHVVPNDF
jgi:two-component system, OmpR family, sensor histidine kinase KdpD